MTEVRIDEKFPLTKKWLPLIHRFSLRYSKPISHLIQESYITEWRTQQKPFYVLFGIFLAAFCANQDSSVEQVTLLFDTLLAAVKEEENYFKLALYRNLYRRVQDWGIFETVPENTSNKPLRYSSDPLKFQGNHARRNGRSTRVDEVFYSLIEMRPFDEIYYNEMVTHMASLIAAQNQVAAQLFLDKMNLQLRWKELRLAQYKEMRRYKFYNAVKLIKTVIKEHFAGCGYDNYLQPARVTALGE